MQNWKDLYTELATRISDNLPQVKWIDMWHNQVNFLDSEHPFPTPAVFLSFRSQDISDTGTRVQQVSLQVDVYLFYETFADTYHGSWNQGSAMAFLDTLNGLQALLHGRSGENYSGMRRISFDPVDTGNAGNLYRISFQCLLADYAAQKTYTDAELEEMNLSKGSAPEEDPGYNDFIIP